jgi:hypothetical protein
VVVSGTGLLGVWLSSLQVCVVLIRTLTVIFQSMRLWTVTIHLPTWNVLQTTMMLAVCQHGDIIELSGASPLVTVEGSTARSSFPGFLDICSCGLSGGSADAWFRV